MAEQERGWLIERRTDPTIPKWWGPPCSRWNWQQAIVSPELWTTDANKAIRFARKEDAEAAIRFEFGDSRNVAATEHVFLARALSPKVQSHDQ